MWGFLKTFFFPGSPFTSDIDPLLKLAGIFSDLLTGILIYKIVKEKLSKGWSNIAAALYIFNPSLIFNSAIWGQYDSLAILFLVSSIYFCLIKKSPIITSFFFSLACIVKPQSLELAPFLFFYFLKYLKPVQWLYSSVAFIATAVLLFFPFFPYSPLYGIYYALSGSTNLFNCTTCNALNFWGIFGTWQNDGNLFLNFPLWYWGIILFLITLSIIILASRKLKGNILYFTISISMLIFYMLLTRMHERYLSYFFPFLLLSAILLKDRILTYFYFFFSFIYLLNLYIPYAYYNNLYEITNLPVTQLLANFNLFSFISFVGFVLLFIYYLRYVKNHSTS